MNSSEIRNEHMTETDYRLGSVLVEKILMPGLITIPEDGYKITDGKISVFRVSFSPILKTDRKLLSSLSEITKHLMDLLSYTVQNGNVLSSSCPERKSGLSDSAFFSGEKKIPVLLLFQNGIFSMKTLPEGVILVTVAKEAETVLPHARETAEEITKKILSFAGETVPYFIEEESAFEEQSLDEESLSDDGVTKVSLSDDAVTENFDLFSESENEWTKKLVTEDPEVLQQEVKEAQYSLSDRERNVRRHRESTLGALKNLFTDADNEARKAGEGKNLDAPKSFRREKRLHTEFSVPDKYTKETHTEEFDVVFFEPNAENPDEWEASFEVLFLRKSDEEKTFTSVFRGIEGIFEESRNGYLMRLRLIGIFKGEEEKAIQYAKTVFASLKG